MQSWNERRAGLGLTRHTLDAGVCVCASHKTHIYFHSGQRNNNQTLHPRSFPMQNSSSQ